MCWIFIQVCNCYTLRLKSLTLFTLWSHLNMFRYLKIQYKYCTLYNLLQLVCYVCFIILLCHFIHLFVLHVSLFVCLLCILSPSMCFLFLFVFLCVFLSILVFLFRFTCRFCLYASFCLILHLFFFFSFCLF